MSFFGTFDALVQYLDSALQRISKAGTWLAAITATLLLFTAACLQPLEASEDSINGSGGINAVHQRNQPYLVLVSIDGFRWDYIDRYPTPNIDRLVATGSRVKRLLPVFPTLTFPNHYSIATGLYPANHGLVGNNFPDPERDKWYSLRDRASVEDRWFYRGEPIWVTAETQGMVAAAFFFVGTEAPIMGVLPTFWRSYDGKISGEQRVDQVLTWLQQPKETRPHMNTLYFENVDNHSHWYGPDSPENIEAISKVDTYIGRLLEGIENLPHADRVNIMLVSDHGLGSYREEPQPFILDQFVSLDGITIIEGGSYLFGYLEKANAERAGDIVATVNRHWAYGHAYTRAQTPPQWHVENNPRFADVILIPEPGYAVLSNSGKTKKISAGDHGWAPGNPAMHGFFVASGPNIRTGVSIPQAEVVDIYPLMLAILGLNGPESIDGDPGKLADILFKAPE